MNREVHVWFCEGVGVKFPRANRPLIHSPLEFNLAQNIVVIQRLRFLKRTPRNRTYFLSWPNHQIGFALRASDWVEFDSFNVFSQGG